MREKETSAEYLFHFRFNEHEPWRSRLYTSTPLVSGIATMGAHTVTPTPRFSLNLTKSCTTTPPTSFYFIRPATYGILLNGTADIRPDTTKTVATAWTCISNAQQQRTSFLYNFTAPLHQLQTRKCWDIRDTQLAVDFFLKTNIRCMGSVVFLTQNYQLWSLPIYNATTPIAPHPNDSQILTLPVILVLLLFLTVVIFIIYQCCCATSAPANLVKIQALKQPFIEMPARSSPSRSSRA
jgi:hypothetical protein